MLNLNEISVKFTSENEILSYRNENEILKSLENGLKSFDRLTEHDAVLVVGDSAASEVFFNYLNLIESMEEQIILHKELGDETLDNNYFPQVFLNSNLNNKFYWNFTQPVDGLHSEQKLAASFCMFKIVSSLKNIKLVLTLADYSPEHLRMFRKYYSLRDQVCFIIVEQTKSEQDIKSDLKLLLANEDYSDMEELKYFLNEDRIICLNKNGPNLIQFSDNKQNLYELIERMPHITVRTPLLDNNEAFLANEPFNSLVYYTNAQVIKLARKCCDIIQTFTQKILDVLNASLKLNKHDLQARELAINKLKRLNVLLSDFLNASVDVDSYFTNLNEILFASILINEEFNELHEELHSFSYYYRFFQSVNSNLKINNWLDDFEGAKTRLQLVINHEEANVKNLFTNCIEQAKNVFVLIRSYFYNQILSKYKNLEAEAFIEQFDMFKTNFIIVLDMLDAELQWNTSECWLKVLNALDELLLKRHGLEFNLEEVRKFFDIKSALKRMVNDFDEDKFELEFYKLLNLFACDLRTEFLHYLNKCVEDMKKKLAEQIRSFKVLLEAYALKEKSYRNMLDMMNKLNWTFEAKENINEFLARFGQFIPVFNAPIAEIEKIIKVFVNNQLFQPFYDQEAVKNELVVLRDLNEIFPMRCEILRQQLLKDSIKLFETHARHFKSEFKVILMSEPLNCIQYYELLSKYLNQLTQMQLKDAIALLKENVTQQDGEKLKKLCEILDKLIKQVDLIEECSPDSETISEAIKILTNRCKQVETACIQSYSELLRDQLGVVWQTLETDMQQLRPQFNTSLAYETKRLIDIVKQFISDVSFQIDTGKATVITMFDLLKAIEEQISKDFAAFYSIIEFDSITQYLMNFMEYYNVDKINIASENRTGSPLYTLGKTLKSIEAECLQAIHKMASNVLLQFKDDIVVKFNTYMSVELYENVMEFFESLIHLIESLSSLQSVKDFSVLILEKQESTLAPDTKLALEMIQNDLSTDVKQLYKELNKQLTPFLNNQLNSCKILIKNKEEKVKIERFRRCLHLFKEDVLDYLNTVEQVDGPAKCHQFLDSVAQLLGKLKEKPAKSAHLASQLMKEFWKIQLVDQNESQKFLDELLNFNLTDWPLPQVIFNEIKSILEQMRIESQFYLKKLKSNQDMFVANLDGAVDIFIQDVKEYLKSMSSSDYDVVKTLIEKIKEALKPTNPMEILDRLNSINDSIGGKLKGVYETLKGDDIVLTPEQQFSTKKSINKSIDELLKHLRVTINELEIKSVKDKADHMVKELVAQVNQLISGEIEKHSDMKFFLNMLEKLKITFNKLVHDKISNFVLWLEGVALEFKFKLDDLDALKDKRIDFYPGTKQLLVNLNEQVKLSLNWYKLLKLIFEKLNEETDPHAPSSLTINLEYLVKLLRKLGISFDNAGVFNQLLSNWSQSLNQQDLNEILNKELTACQISELKLMHQKSYQPFESKYNPETQRLDITGNLILVSKLLNEIQAHKVSLVVVNANNIVCFDADLVANGVNLFVIAPAWHINKSVTVDLSGSDAKLHELPRARDGSINEINGAHGLDGVAGQNGGHFYGICGSQTKNDIFKKINFITNGGNGSDGQHGGDGSDGQPGKNAAPMHITNVEVFEPDISESFKYTGIIFKKVLKVFQRNGTDGHRGGNAGNGGYPGMAGQAGQVRVLLNKKFFNFVGSPGKNGQMGKRGNPGNGGKHGNHYESVWDMKKRKWIVENEVIERAYQERGNHVHEDKLVKPPASTKSKLNFSTDGIKSLIQKVLNRKVIQEKCDIYTKLQYELLNKFYDELQTYCRQSEKFAKGENMI